MDDKLFHVHEALHLHEFTEYGELRHCICGRLQMSHISRDFVGRDWLDCSFMGEELIDDTMLLMAIKQYCSGEYRGLRY